jgi:excinuclease ABC subunit C
VVAIGPFTDGKFLKIVLRYLRKPFPYYTQKHRILPCSYCHLSLCPGPNPDKREYKKSIAKIKAILNGKKPRVITFLKKEMADFAKNLEFEKAAKARDQIAALENIFAHIPKVEITPLLTKEGVGVVKSLEAYDISNIQGKEPVASMVRFDNGKPNKSLYRKFKIRLPEKPDDCAMMREVIRRRLRHTEWPYPDMFLIDGGRGQLNAALSQLSVVSCQLSVVALAKKHNELYLPNREKPISLDTLPKDIKNLFMYARDEAHRFAISYHRKLHRLMVH